MDPTDALSFVQNEYDKECGRQDSDIFEHLPVLRELATTCRTVAEMGVRNVVSTWALLVGLTDGAHGGQGKHLLCVDVEAPPQERIEPALDAARALGINMTIIQDNSATCQLPVDSVDLLFIDTWHVYGHLRRELQQHAPKVNKFIAMHDTEVDAEEGESLRMGYNIEEQMQEYGYPREEITTGLKKAVDEFLAAKQGVWEVHLHRTNNNGLTVLRRISGGP